MVNYKDYRIIDGKPRWVIVDENVNRDPSKEDLKNLDNYVGTKRYHGGNYNKTNTCDNIKNNGERCGKDFHGKAFKEYTKGKWTKRWICSECYYDINYTNKHNKYLLDTYGTLDENKISNIKKNITINIINENIMIQIPVRLVEKTF